MDKGNKIPQRNTPTTKNKTRKHHKGNPRLPLTYVESTHSSQSSPRLARPTQTNQRCRSTGSQAAGANPPSSCPASPASGLGPVSAPSAAFVTQKQPLLVAGRCCCCWRCGCCWHAAVVCWVVPGLYDSPRLASLPVCFVSKHGVGSVACDGGICLLLILRRL